VLAGAVAAAVVAAGMIVVLDDDATVTPREQAPITRGADRIPASGDIAEILRVAVPAVVAIVADGGPGRGGGAGTGFVVSQDGVIVTNSHVIQGATQLEARFADGSRRTATVLGAAPSSDLAVLKVDAEQLPFIELGDSDAVQVGDDVVAIGNALALAGGLSVTRGIVSGLHRDVPTSDGAVLADLIQTDAAINPGNSGGPLVDARGRVIAINTAIADPRIAQNVGFAIPISQVKSLISELTEGRRPAVLGVSVDPTADEEGAVVTEVNPGSPAAQGGIEVGDVVLRVGDTRVRSGPSLRPAIRRYRAGETVDVVVLRNGERMTLRVLPGEADEEHS
jgi:putative serine protease PepD